MKSFWVFIDKAGVRELSDRWQFLSSNSPCIRPLQEESYTCQLTSLVYQLVHHSLVRNRGANCQLLLWDMGTRGWPLLHMTPCWAVVGLPMLCTVLFAGSVLSASEQKLNCLIDPLITDHCFLLRCNCPKQFLYFIDYNIITKSISFDICSVIAHIFVWQSYERKKKITCTHYRY